MMDEKQKAFLFGMRGILKKSKSPDAKAQIKLLDCIIDGFGVLDDMSIPEINLIIATQEIDVERGKE